MDGWLAPIITAAIGAGAGSWVAVFIEGRRERDRARLALARVHLFPLQDALEYLWFRLKNLRDRKMVKVTSPEYLEMTTVYALGRVLACERLLGLTGAYADIEEAVEGLSAFLRENRLDAALQGTNFFQYDRVTLAEFTMEGRDDEQRASSFVDFRTRYERTASPDYGWLEAARTFLKGLVTCSTRPGSCLGGWLRRPVCQVPFQINERANPSQL